MLSPCTAVTVMGSGCTQGGIVGYTGWYTRVVHRVYIPGYTLSHTTLGIHLLAIHHCYTPLGIHHLGYTPLLHPGYTPPGLYTTVTPGLYLRLRENSAQSGAHSPCCEERTLRRVVPILPKKQGTTRRRVVPILQEREEKNDAQSGAILWENEG